MNADKRVIVYPQYLDSKRTVAEGRRIPKHLAADEPSTHEVFDIVKALKFEAEIEAKHYPRDWIPRGRVRVLIKGDDGKPVNPDIPDRRSLLLRIAELVPKHPNRTNPKARQAAAAAGAAAAGAGPSSSAAGASGSGAGASSSKPAPSKKGKKGKK
ncbi:hypothetical protein Agub_g10702 [Astrephomene gubernaculifera]|uniref:Signal recognition particle 19 kDa protein n=1 Tax=Astrephomene gubernaculifera TaxID=47775 RepID=A0AAD3DX80_9CHLO|nr:hypothetical protein Agub_g10702 [Astrephomene gubernaculifera]